MSGWGDRAANAPVRGGEHRAAGSPSRGESAAPLGIRRVGRAPRRRVTVVGHQDVAALPWSEPRFRASPSSVVDHVQLAEAFVVFIRDGSRYISTAELVHSMARMGHPNCYTELTYMMRTGRLDAAADSPPSPRANDNIRLPPLPTRRQIRFCYLFIKVGC